ncbi:n6-adenosine-methyltransferase ime4 [Anopheles darlingi]|uniref:mRNA m(6)A methyltransferase n=1 Tax=Anopheles darlingi TaxID=43151 RepID=W5JQ69_ANODA|nr:N6-adenosine-methyltransferase MT-A70-like protein isoform X2 [Anopheles darlingi]ETN66281.1 n6-adenosine-methyltransferase ime4 [Anopheles darlingi]
MSSWEEIQAVKVKRNSLREKLEKRKKERQDLLLGNSSPAGPGGVVSLIKLESGGSLGDDKDIDAEVEKCLVKVLADQSLILPTNSTQITERVESMMQKTAPLRDSVAYYLHKMASQNLINIKEVSIGGTVGYEVISAEHTRIQALHDDLGLSHVPMAVLADLGESGGKRKAMAGEDDELLLKGSGGSKVARSATGLKDEGHRGKGAGAADSSSSSSSASAATSVACQASDIMSLLSLPSTREKQHKKVGEEILELLSKPTAKERSLAEKFKSQGGAQVMEFCPHGTRIECMRSLDAANEAAAAAAASAAKERSDSNNESRDSADGRTDGETGTKQDSDSQSERERGSRSKNGAELHRGTDIADVKKEPTTDPGDTMSSNSNSNSNSSGAATESDSKQTVVNKYRCNKLHFKKIIQNHTDETLGDCSFLNTCFHMDTCKYVHYQVDTYQTVGQTGPGGALAGALAKPDGKTKAKVKPKALDDALAGGAAGGGTVGAGVGAKRSPITNEPCATLYPPQWIQCDLRFLDMTVLGKFAVVMADPPWDIHMELPYGTMSDDEMRQLGVPALQDDGLIFLWVTGRAMELGRECLKLWGYERVDELIWVKTNQLQRIIRTGRTGHWLNHGKEHCLVGMKGNPPNLNRGLDCDVIVAEVRATSHKPDEIYGIIERLSPGTRKIELFGRPHNVQPNWITLGNQLDGIQIVDPELISSFRNRYPDGNCMTPGKNP